MWTQNSWSRANGTTRLIWWVQRVGTINGKPVNRRASMLTIFSSIGNRNRLCVRRDTKASVGLPPLTTGKTRSSTPAFSTTDCQVCPSRSQCTQSIRHTRRTVTIRPQEQYQALKQRRKQEETKEFKQAYAKRAG